MIRELTPIRFALCMMIFAHHAFSYAAGGAPAVAAFFMLSGFCMTLGYKDKIISGSINYIDYLKARLAKIYPIHWITFIAFFLITLYTGDAVINKRMMLSNFLLLQSWIPERSFYFSYNAIAWYLSTALFAYLCFPMIIHFFNKITCLQRICLLVIMLAGYGVVVYAMPQSDYHAMLYINPACRCIDYIIGIYLAEWFSRIEANRLRKCGWVFDMGLIISFVMLNAVSFCLTKDMRSVSAFFWLPSAALILCTSLASKLESPLSKLLQSVIIQKSTACSFSLMMWSVCVIQLFAGLNAPNALMGGGNSVLRSVYSRAN